LNFNGVSLAQDLDGGSLQVTWNTANMTANGSLGALLLHHHNARGRRAEVVVLDGAQYADLQITSGVSTSIPAPGQNRTFMLTARNNGPNNASNVRVVDRLPSGLNFVSSTSSAGSYNPATGVWTIGNLNNGGGATLQIVATLNGANPVENVATIVGDSPVDTVPDNNVARHTLTATRRADLALTMDVSSATTLANNSVTYTLTVRNDGDDPAYNVRVTEAFSGFPALKPASFKVSAGVYNPTTNIWSLASLGRGFSETLSFTVAAPNMVGPLRNRATVVSDTSDMNTDNDSANAATQVYQMNVTLSDPLACTGPDSLLNVTATINTSGMIRESINVAAQPQVSCQLFVVGNSCSVTGATGTCSTNPSQVSFSGVVSAPTITINYQVRAGDQVAQNTDLCVVSNVSAGGDQTGSVTACAKATCPAAGPGDPFPPSAEVSDQKAGSVLIYNIYTSDAATPNSQDSRINITNIDANRSAIVKLFLIDGATCSAADNFICLTPNQTASFLASDLDPGGTGYIVAVAVNSQGRPINFNNLIGDVYVKFASGHAANLGAEAISALGGGPPVCDQSSETARLDFDGVSYNRMPRMLALDNIPSSADGADTMIILNSIGGDLRSNADRLTNLFGVFYNDVEAGVSFSFNANACQFRSSVNNSFPRITPRFGEFVPSGRSGWLRLFSNNDQGILGAAINFNPNVRSDANAFNQGHNLHKLTLSTSASITIPVFPPNC
jgi:uncharacterized repeat protein (TIGR01451 family)